MPEITAEAVQRAIRWDMCLECGRKLTKFRANVVTAADALARRADRPQLCRDCAVADAVFPKDGNPQIVWITRERSKPWSNQSFAWFELPDADAVMWYASGRPAYRDEAILALKAVIPALLEACNEDASEFQRLGIRVRALVPTLPREGGPDVTMCKAHNLALGCALRTDDQQVLGCTKESCPLFHLNQEGEAA